MSRTTCLPAILEIDHERGVIYVHLTNAGDIMKFGTHTILRICQLPPIPRFDLRNNNEMLDITHMHSVSWSK